MKYVIKNEHQQYLCKSDVGQMWDTNLQLAVVYENIAEAIIRSERLNAEVVGVKEVEVIVKKLERL